eukprot:1233413-Prymnesium_polylepis.1
MRTATLTHLGQVSADITEQTGTVIIGWMATRSGLCATLAHQTRRPTGMPCAPCRVREVAHDVVQPYVAEI